MNKTAIKNYAVWARVQLIEAVRQRAFEYEITEGGENKPDLDSINGRVLSAEEKEQRSRLIELIKQKGYEQPAARQRAGRDHGNCLGRDETPLFAASHGHEATL